MSFKDQILLTPWCELGTCLGICNEAVNCAAYFVWGGRR